MMGIIRLLGGEQLDKVNWKSTEVTSVLSSIRDHVHEIMSVPVQKRFEKWYSDAPMHYNAVANWELVAVSKSLKFSEMQSSFFNLAVHYLSQYYGEVSSSFIICHQASLRRGYGSQTTNVHERLHLGDIVQILVNSGDVRSSILDTNAFVSNIDCHDNEKGKPTLFVIGAFINSRTQESWIAAKQCKVLTEGNIGQIPDFNAEPLLPVFTTYMFDCHRHHRL